MPDSRGFFVTKTCRECADKIPERGRSVPLPLTVSNSRHPIILGILIIEKLKETIMENLSSPIPSDSVIAHQDAIFSKIQQAKAILTCVMFATEFVNNDITLDSGSIYNALWVVDQQLDELEKLCMVL